MSKEIWIEVHEKLVDEYLEEHPDAEWDEAYHATEDDVDEAYADHIGGMIDAIRSRKKYEDVGR